MIEFKGELTGNCRKFAIKGYILFKVLVASSTIIVCALPAALFAHIFSEVAFLIWSPFLLIFLASILPPTKAEMKKRIANRVFIDLDERTIVCNYARTDNEIFKMIDDVVSVIDHGEWYSLSFSTIPLLQYLNLQKDLLTEGTLEEFEALFEGKIERRIKEKK